MGLAFCDQPFNRNLIARFLRRKSHIERTRWQVSYQCWSLWGMDAVKWIDKCILLSDTINHRLFIWPVVIPNEPLIGHFVIFFPSKSQGVQNCLHLGCLLCFGICCEVFYFVLILNSSEGSSSSRITMIRTEKFLKIRYEIIYQNTRSNWGLKKEKISIITVYRKPVFL